jgi:glutaredoxin
MKFTVYSKQGCPYCDKIKKVLEISNQDYTIKILDKDFTIEEYLSTFSPKSPFPQVVLHESGQDTHLGGCIQTVKFLKQNNIVL